MNRSWGFSNVMIIDNFGTSPLFSNVEKKDVTGKGLWQSGSHGLSLPHDPEMKVGCNRHNKSKGVLHFVALQISSENWTSNDHPIFPLNVVTGLLLYTPSYSEQICGFLSVPDRPPICPANSEADEFARQGVSVIGNCKLFYVIWGWVSVFSLLWCWWQASSACAVL